MRRYATLIKYHPDTGQYIGRERVALVGSGQYSYRDVTIKRGKNKGKVKRVKAGLIAHTVETLGDCPRLITVPLAHLEFGGNHA